MGKTVKKAAPAAEKKVQVKKVIEKKVQAKKVQAKKRIKLGSPVKNAVKAEKKPAGISGKYSGLKQQKPKAKPVPADDNIVVKIDGEKATTTSAKKQKKTQVRRSYTKGVVKINSLPHGFYEDQLQGYFTQFGEVTNVKVMRSLKTGRSKGVAFVEFAIPEVAEIAAETMNNYLLFKSLLKTEYLPPGKVKAGLFKTKVQVVTGADGKTKIRSKVIEARDTEVRKLNKAPTKVQIAKRQAKLADKLKKQNKFIKKLGVDLDVETLVDGKLAKGKTAKSGKRVQSAEAAEEVVQKKAKVEGKKEQKEITPAAEKIPAPKASTVPEKKQAAVPEKKQAAVPEKKQAAVPEKKQADKKQPASKPAPKKKAVVDSPLAVEKPVAAAKKSKVAKGKTAVAEQTVINPVVVTPLTPTPKKKVAKKPAKVVAKDNSPQKKKPAPKAKKALVLKPTTPPKAPAAKAKGTKEKTAVAKKSIEKKKPLKLNTKKSVK